MKKTLTYLAILFLISTALAGSMELTSARLYKKQKEWAKALQFYNDAIAKDPASADAYFERGELLGGIAADATLKDVAAQIAIDKSDPSKDLYQRMLADFEVVQSGRLKIDDKTAKKFSKQIKEILEERWFAFYASAVHNDSLYNEAKAEGQTDPDPEVHLERAIADLDMAIMLIPSKWNAHGMKAQLLGKQNRHKEATEAWKEARRHLVNHLSEKKEAEENRKALEIINANLLENYYSQERYNATIQLADELLATNPNDVDAIQYKAFALARLSVDTSLTAEQRNSTKAEAIRALERARSARPDDPIILYYMGQFNLQLGDTAAAIQSFNEYLKIDSLDRDVLFALGVLYLEGGSFTNTEKARKLYERLTEADPNDPAAWINFGVALIRLGETEAGRKALEKGKSLQNK